MHSLIRTAAALTALAALVGDPDAPVPRTFGALRHEAYVWRRSWGADVERAVRDAAPGFSRLVVLGAEIEWRTDGAHVATSDAEIDAARGGEQAGVALRVGAWPGPFDADGDATRQVVATATDLLEAARARGADPSELQIDFDCATSKLAGFRTWIDVLRRAAAPTPVTFTALPAWLRSREFAALARASDGFVLQVHSLEPPARPGELVSLCDAGAARAWVERAARIGMPFRVALPTYGYLAGFSPEGALVGVAAEGETPAWPRGTRTVPLASDAGAMAHLVREWTANRPVSLDGIIWYRLPLPGDRRNWTAEALRLVRNGETPRADVTVTLERADAALAELRIANRGSADAPAPDIALRWSGARLVASDALAGFEARHSGDDGLVVRPTSREPLAAGSSRLVAWLRFDGAAEVTADAMR